MLYILNTIGIAAIAAIGLNILIWLYRQISLGHGAFFGVGATRRIMPPDWEWDSISPYRRRVLLPALVGHDYRLPSGRFEGLYLTIATLAGQFYIEYVLIPVG